ncbi:uncharacterized protein LOC142976281 [Anticarsia gemmatalis]|uniref:uncharacterized protein LOC142976281 n=1 Tax=Anticarsia gemmatalis TaxID=129554 RepID=UPI003F76AD37
MLSIRCLIFAAICYQNVSCGHKLLCNFEDSDCLTSGTKRIFQEYVNGNLRGVSTSDPLHVELIEASLPTIDYKLFNSTLSGMRTCEPELVKIRQSDQTFIYHVACKHLILEGQYECDGDIGPICVKGNGDYEINMYDYVFILTGEYNTFFDKEERLHLQAKSFKVDVDARGKVVYDYKNLFDGDEEKSAAAHKFANANWKQVDKIVRGPVWDQFVGLFMKNANNYLRIKPIDYIFRF